MKKILTVSAFIILIGIVLFFSLFYSGKDRGKEVYTHKVEKGDILSTVLASGRIEPRTKVNISSNVVGEIVKLNVKEGDRVKKGDILLQLDRESYLSEVDRLEANVRLSKIMIEKEKVNLRNIENNLRRMKRLHQDHIISEEDIEEAELQYETAKINLKSLKEKMIQASADLEKARDELKKTAITSPIDGVVTQLNAEVGEQVIVGTINNPGTVIMVISDMREVLAEVDVDETEIVCIKKGNKARIKVDAVGDTYEYEGLVEEIGNTAIKQGEINIFRVKIKMKNPDERLRPGMTARAKIETESRYDVLKVPIQAVVLRDIDKEKKGASSGSASGNVEEKTSSKWKEKEKEAVYLMVDGKAILAPVETGLSDELDVEIRSGVKEGDLVVTGPYRTLKNLKEGDRIRKKKEGKESEEEEEEEEKEG